MFADCDWSRHLRYFSTHEPACEFHCSHHCAVGHAGSELDDGLGTLREGDSVRIQYGFQGCGGGAKRDYVFWKASDLYVSIWHPSPYSGTTDDVLLGILKLSASDIVRFDGLLQTYLDRPGDMTFWSTSTERIRIMHRRHGILLASEDNKIFSHSTNLLDFFMHLEDRLPPRIGSRQ